MSIKMAQRPLSEGCV